VPIVPSAWIDEVAAALRPLFGTDHVYYTEPAASYPSSHSSVAEAGETSAHRLFVHHPLIGEAFADDLGSFFVGFEQRFTTFRDEETTMIRRLVRSAGAGAFHDAPLYDARRQAASSLHRRVFQSRGIERKIALSVPLPVGEAMLVVGFNDRSAPRFEGRRHRLLELLLPAFEAGVRIRRRRTASPGLSAAARGAPIPVVFLDTEGRERFRNEAFDTLLRDLASRQESTAAATRDAISPDRLQTAVRELARNLQDSSHEPGRSSLSAAPSASGGPADDPSPDASLSTTRSLGTIRLRACRGTTYEETPGVVVFVETPLVLPVGGLTAAPGAVLPHADRVQARSPLTRRQAQVALLIARGLSDQDVAQELGISVHTARRHAGQILSKLGLSSRAGVAVALLQATA
jgi:DNA-binding CsgD family transcriptional regulator